MEWLDRKYANQLSVQLDKFHPVKDNYNFRCPLCGDSKKSLSKARGWILFRGSRGKYNVPIYKCHNCHAGMAFHKFLNIVNPQMYYDYRIEKMAETGEVFEEEEVIQKFDTTDALKRITKISRLPVGHPAKKYVGDRLIPAKSHYKLYYAPKFREWTNSIVPDTFESIKRDEPRLIIPLLTRDEEMFGFQGRSFDPKSDCKYITILTDKSKPLIYGLDTIVPTRKVYMFEGPLDSLFIDNAGAGCGGRIESEIENTNLSKEKTVICYDNEPRAKKTISKMERALDAGYSICVWPNNLKETDVNDMILSGFTSNDIRDIIDRRTYKGLAAKLMIADWSRV